MSRYLRLGSLIIALVAFLSVGQAAETKVRPPSTRSDQYAFDRPNISNVKFAALTRSDPEERKRQPAQSVSLEPFRTFQLEMPHGPLLEKWDAVLKDLEPEDQLLAGCEVNRTSCPSAAATFFLTIIDRARLREGRARIGEVNRSINLAIRPQPRVGASDTWRTPLATLATGVGDCKNYAVVKYVALRRAGVAEEDLRLMIVHDTRVHADHAVVTVRLDGRWLVLDNRWLPLAEDRDLPWFVPLFSFGQSGVSRSAAARPQRRRTGPDRF